MHMPNSWRGGGIIRSAGGDNHARAKVFDNGSMTKKVYVCLAFLMRVGVNATLDKHTDKHTEREVGRRAIDCLPSSLPPSPIDCPPPPTPSDMNGRSANSTPHHAVLVECAAVLRTP